MSKPDFPPRYRPLLAEGAELSELTREPLIIKNTPVIALIIMCDLDTPPVENTSPTLSVSIAQYLKLQDGSLIKLDMDRGLTSFWHGNPNTPRKWRQTADKAIQELLTIVKADVPHQIDFPWEEYVKAATQRGIDIDEAKLRALPYQVTFSDALMKAYGF
ncbi:MAG TPA: hypothetical protein H9821_03995 [Candidatus Rothia avicola]|uniref:Uncharacterized protein n=1 Tax=Candidatus Rothia avicola TaxID=2840478 RepID=A0A9D1ZSW5_9MICC|nr:hypothetical protein [Candidatus Rothia avicola]